MRSPRELVLYIMKCILTNEYTYTFYVSSSIVCVYWCVCVGVCVYVCLYVCVCVCVCVCVFIWMKCWFQFIILCCAARNLMLKSRVHKTDKYELRPLLFSSKASNNEEYRGRAMAAVLAKNVCYKMTILLCNQRQTVQNLCSLIELTYSNVGQNNSLRVCF